jgi:cation/acetate symporter
MFAMSVDPWILAFSSVTVIVTIWMGFRSAKTSKTASDFFVAGRSVSVGWNASAISGEYLSAASFMGIAGMVMSSGYDALWYPVCYACGYLFLLLFIAGPLRRFGAYTIPDFAEGRYDSPVFRKIAVCFVLFIGFFYTMPQMKGAGTTLAYIFPGLPYWAGVVLVGAVITLNVALGGMKGITLVQAFQYWAKMFAISVPIFVLMAVYGHYGKQLEVNGNIQHPTSNIQTSTNAPSAELVQKLQNAEKIGEAGQVAARKEFSVKAATDLKAIQATAKSYGMEFALRNAFGTEYREVTRMASGDAKSVFAMLYWLGGFGEILWVDSWTNFPVKLPASAKNMSGGLITVPRDEAVKAALDSLEAAGACLIPAGSNRCLVVKKSEAADYERVMQRLGWIPAASEFRKPLPEKAPKDETWLSPFGPLTTKAAKAAKLSPEEAKPYSLLYTYSLIIALICGTAGLPHILVRFYTNPDGGAAKRTTMWVMILIGIFYVFPPVFGVMGRNLFPELYNGIGAKGTDKIVLELPRLLNEKYAPLGSILSGITCAGAFAAFMSTFSGLLVSMTGALAHDVYGRMLRPKSTPEQRMRMFKFAAVLIGFVSILLGSLVEPLEINFMVGQAFAIAAASYFPLLFMSVWWRGMTMRGAAVGMLTGGLCALVAATLTNVSNLALDKGPMGKIFAGFAGMNDFWAQHPLLRILCEQPAIWTVPLAITLMIVVSKATRKDVPSDVRMKMLVLHAPEKLGLKQEYIQEHQAGGH